MEPEVQTAGGTPAPQTESAPQTQAPQQSSPPATPATSVGGEIGNAGQKSDVELSAFTPNYKFKAYGQEYEIPEFVRGLVKDQPSEKQIKEIFEKAYGLDVMKPKLERTRTELNEVLPKYKSLQNRVNQLGMYLNNEDFDNFFAETKVPFDKLMGWMHARLQEKELPPHVQSEIQRARQIQRENYQLQNQMEQVSQTALSQQEQAKLGELQSALSKPEVQTVMTAFDQRRGPGAFEREVIQRAAFLEQHTKQDINAEQIVTEVLAVLGAGPLGAHQASQAAPGTATPQGNGQGQSQNQAKPPVIPNVGGKNTSPTRKLATSIDDLKKLRASRQYG